MPTSVGTVAALFLKPAKNCPMVDVSRVGMTLRAGQGIEGDCNAHPLSPRQALLTRREDLEDFSIGAGDLRENIVIQGLPSNRFAPGSILGIGEQAAIRLTFHCEPCKRIAHVVDVRSVVGRRGILGVVLRGGHVGMQDAVLLCPERRPPLPESPYERFLLFVSAVPEGLVVTYKQVVIGMGVAESYIRAIPRYLRRTCKDEFPIHRIVDSQGQLVSEYVPGQLNSLRAEGIDVISSNALFGPSGHRVDTDRFGWPGAPIHR
ncbi:MAG: MOSC domain-containing protein [Egibacteraceae bacterium]